MIRFALRCEKDHEFEAWFRSGDDYDRLAGEKAVNCAVCGSTRVEKALMAPAVARSSRTRGMDIVKVDAGREAAPAADEKVQLATSDPRERALRSAIRELRQKVTERADYVGNRFAEEARKIHHQEVEPRGIYGEATSEDAKALAEEGIDFYPLPSLPEDQN
ncbi:DUF1178 family protein [Bauldia litoralis]|uniref:DUF1178 family protein n=1 Tax=Bauldia litoralis TaxID=665467 RepID=UPI0032630E15